MTATPAPAPLSVVLTVGTDHHPFDRVVAWVDEWVAAHADRAQLLAQVGSSSAATAGESHDLLDPARLAEAMAGAHAVVCHGGPGTIIDARRAGIEPIVVPRRAADGEHVDDHQVRFTTWLAARGQLEPATSREELHHALDRVLDEPDAYRRGAGPAAGDAVARRFGELVEALLSVSADRLTVVYVGGCGRSGSTLLDRMLGALPNVVAVGELVHLVQRGLIEDEVCPCGQPFHACPFWTPVTTRALGAGADAGELRRLQAAVDRNRLVPRMLVPALAGKHRADQQAWADVVGRLLHEAAAEAGASVVVDSSKHASTAYLLRRVPGIDLRVVHLVRDARGMAHSWTRSVSRPEARESARATMRRHPPGRSAARWLAYNTMFEALRLATDVPVVRVAYEDLVTWPRRELGRILDRVGAEAGLDPSLPFLHDGTVPPTVSLQPGHSVAGNPMRFSSGDIPLRVDAAWRDEMTGRDRATVTAIALPLLAAYGYLGGSR